MLIGFKFYYINLFFKIVPEKPNLTYFAILYESLSIEFRIRYNFMSRLQIELVLLKFNSI